MEEQLLSNKERSKCTMRIIVGFDSLFSIIVSELMDAMQGWEDKTANKETEARELHNQLINAEAMLEVCGKEH